MRRMYIIVFFVMGLFWGSFLLTKIFCLECFPTQIRGTSSGWRSFSFALGITIGSLLSSALVKVMPLSMIYILFSGLALLIIPVLVIKFLPETKGLKIVDI